jgi:tRNA pseudouridine38-40 synthase
MSETAPKAALTPADLAVMLRYATDWLGVYREQVNALNVYPVPDGDTGTNMHLTMQSVRRELDWPAVQAAAKVLRGKHDFWAFSGENDRTYETTVRDLRRLELRRKGRRITMTFEADGFIYKMARSLTGALVNVGLGKLKPADLAVLLKTRGRIPAVVTAPPQGLFLVKVIY